VDLRPTGGHRSRPQIILVHGTPILNTLYWTEDRPDSFCSKMASAAGVREGDLVSFGHTHKPWHRQVEGVRFVNTGSVGKPKDGDPRAGYVLVEVGGEIGAIEFVRVEYDVERAAEGILRSELPNEFADQLRAGGAPKPVEVT
jgi:predicted phosphodiesterase